MKVLKNKFGLEVIENYNLPSQISYRFWLIWWLPNECKMSSFFTLNPQTEWVRLFGRVYFKRCLAKKSKSK